MIEQIKQRVVELIPAASVEEGGQWLTFKMSPEDWATFAPAFKLNKELGFDYLFCVTGVDWKTHFTMVYHLHSTVSRETIVIKVDLTDRNDPVIASVSNIWRTAELHEREAYDLFGVKFKGHPDLRRLFLTEEWKGYPLRKDYEDPVNMIKL